MAHFRSWRAAITFALALGVSACASSGYTGPIEVTRFASAQTAALGQGTIALRFSEELKNEAALDAFRGAISDQLSLLGYTVIGNEEVAGQIATITTSRNPVESQLEDNPVSVGVGAGTGTFGSGAGVGVGINLGGTGNQSPRVVSELSVAIASRKGPSGQPNLWEARAQFPTSINSPYAPVAVNARALATAIFKDFPQGDGQTITLKASELVEP